MSTPDDSDFDPQRGVIPPAHGQPQYGAPAQPPYAAPAQPPYGAPAQPAYGVPPQPAYGVPAQPPYGAPGSPPPAQPHYGAQAPQYPAAPQYPVAPQPYPTGQQYAHGAPYGAPGAYGYPQPKPSTGTLSWALGFLIFIGIPFLSGIVSAVVMASVYGSVARKGDVARQNARSAANWALTYLTVSIVLLIIHVIVLVQFAGEEGMTGFFPLGIPFTVYCAVSILHVVLVIVGTVKASGGKVLRVPFAIPYIRS